MRFCLFLIFFIAFGFLPHDVHARLLRMNSQFPADTLGSKIDHFFADRLREKTNGALEVHIFWAGRAGSSSANVKRLSDGDFDIGALSPRQFADEMPLLASPTSFPMLFHTTEQVSSLMPRLVKEEPAILEEAEKHNLYPFLFHVDNPTFLLSRRPISSLSDLKGLRVRTWGSRLPLLFEALKAKPVNLFMPEVYRALEKKELDAIPISLEQLKRFRLQEKASYVTQNPLWISLPWVLFFNKDTWLSLSEEERRIIQETAEEARQKELQLLGDEQSTSLRSLKKQGVRFSSLSGWEAMDWKARAPDFVKEWVEEMSESGKEKEARNMVRIIHEIVYPAF